MEQDHPEEKLIERLMEKARGRVLRSDRIYIIYHQTSWSLNDHSKYPG